MIKKMQSMLFKVVHVWRHEGSEVVMVKIKNKLMKKKNAHLSSTLIPKFMNNCKDEFFFIDIAKENNPVIRTLRVKDEFDYSMEVPFLIEPTIQIDKIAAIVHIFYPEVADEIASYLNNIPCDVDVFISTNTEEKKQQIEEIFSTFSKGNVEVRIFENRGRDIAPKLIGFKDVYDQYEIFVHIHSKKSPHGGDGLVDWRKYSYETLLGSKEIVTSILHLMEKDRIGMVFPQHFRALRACINWGYDYEAVEILLARLGINIDSESFLEFPSGSMFWGRSEAIKPLLNCGLEFSDFPEENGQIDGTLAHAIERSFLYIVESQGFRWLKISKKDICPDHHAILEYNHIEKFPSLIKKVYRPLFNKYVQDKGKLRLVCNELKYYKCFPEDHIKRPRLNLLVPTINPSEVFGGVSTAIKLFEELQKVLVGQFDYRIIVTDAKIQKDAVLKYQDCYSISNNLNCGSDDHQGNMILDATDADCGYLHVREDDIFIATAWWTALTGFDILKHQERLFKTSKKLIYLIQDYESNFNQWSSRWAMAEETYCHKDKTVAIFNCEELATFMLDRYSFDRSYYIPYRINEKMKTCLRKEEKYRQIVIYGRPSVQRNAFEIIIDGISLWQKKYPICSKEWKIISLGESFPKSYANNINNIDILGKVSLEEYATILNKSSIGISLMVSPHPSYPPLEMSYFGLLTITNNYDQKDLSLRSDNIITLNSCCPENVAICIQEARERLEATQFCTSSGEIKDLDIDVEKYDAVKFSEMMIRSLSDE